MTDRGRPGVYGEVHTLSLFRCDGCKSILLYKTHYLDFVTANEADELNPTWIFGLDDVDADSDFQDHSTLLYSTPAFQEDWIPIQHSFTDRVPTEVKKAYQKAFKVKHEPNSFAVHIRKALEALCKNRGKPGKNLKQDLSELAKAENYPPIIAEIAQELREIGNRGAHTNIEKEQLPAINDFFNLVVTYVYEAPAHLEDYRKLLQPETPEIISEDTVH